MVVAVTPGPLMLAVPPDKGANVLPVEAAVVDELAALVLVEAAVVVDVDADFELLPHAATAIAPIRTTAPARTAAFFGCLFIMIVSPWNGIGHLPADPAPRRAGRPTPGIVAFT